MLDRIDSGEASCLIVSDLEWLTRRTAQLETILERLEKGRARLVALDVGLDSATEPGGLAMGAVARRHPPRRRPSRRPNLPPPRPRARVRLRDRACARGHESPGRAAACDRALLRAHGIEVVKLVREREPKDGQALDRAGLSFLIERIAAGDASCLVVTELQRLSRSVTELGTIVQWLERNKVRLIALELDLDTARPGAHMTARALASVAGMEHDRLSERTRKGLAAARAKRRSAGAAGPDWDAIRKRIAKMRAGGMTLQAIADTLNKEGVPTQLGGTKWRPSSVHTAAGYKRPSRSSKVSDSQLCASGHRSGPSR